MTTPPELTLHGETLALLVDALEDYAVFLLAPDGAIRWWNAGAARLMGYSAEEVVGRNFSSFYGPEDLAAKEGRIEDEGWRLRKDGSRFWANTVITAVRDEQGTITGFAKITRDLSKRREAEERLRQNEEMFRLLIDSVRDYAIFMLDPEGRIVTWNTGAQRIKGYTPDEVIGRHFSMFFPEEDIAAGKPER